MVHASNTINVEATLTVWMRDALKAATYSSFFDATPTVYELWPESVIDTPAYSITHIPAAATARGQSGAEDGVRYMQSRGLLEVDCWVSRSDVDWYAQLVEMRGIVRETVIQATPRTIKDYSDLDEVTDTGYRVVIGDIEVDDKITDTGNPDFERQRILVSYQWHERATQS